MNPINRKARSIPVFNIFNVYARAFHFSWLGFMIAVSIHTTACLISAC